MLRSSNRPRRNEEALSLIFLSLIALFVVALVTGCARLSSSPAPAAPLTIQQRQDFFSVLEGLSAVQAAIPEFRMENHPASTKPGIRTLGDQIRWRCKTDPVYDGAPRELRAVYVSGADCPVDLRFQLEVHTLGSSETRAMSWTYDVSDQATAALNTVDRISLRGSQRATSSDTWNGRRSEASYQAQAVVRSPQLGEGSLEILGSETLIISSGEPSVETTMTLRLQFPTFDAVAVLQSRKSDARSVQIRTLNGVPLSSLEATRIHALLPRLGLALD